MTIKNKNNNINIIDIIFKKINIFCTTDFGLLCRSWVIVLVPTLIVFLIIKMFFFKSFDFREKALNLVRNNYPSLICLSPQGGIRIYPSKTYEVFNDPDNGWQVYNRKQGHIESSTFHISRCELK